jgi:hypothetical protein
VPKQKDRTPEEQAIRDDLISRAQAEISRRLSYVRVSARVTHVLIAETMSDAGFPCTAWDLANKRHRPRIDQKISEWLKTCEGDVWFRVRSEGGLGCVCQLKPASSPDETPGE